MKKPIIILTGPTAVGKTQASIELAKKIGGEIISADSMQVYQQMNIGTAKITSEEMQGIPHYLVDVLPPDAPFHVYEFQQLAKQSLKQIYDNGHIPIVVGGTGFYIQALLYDIQFQEEKGSHGYREKLEEIAQNGGGDLLYHKLESVDPESAKAIHKNNIKRIIRALEYYEETGNPIFMHNEEQRQKDSPYCFLYAVLTMNRSQLYHRINKRVDLMMEQGLEEEVAELQKRGYGKELTSMQAIGYKEWFPFFEGKCSREEVVEQIKKDTRHFAKRQLTWFRREREVYFIDKDAFLSEADIVNEIIGLAKEQGVL